MSIFSAKQLDWLEQVYGINSQSRCAAGNTASVHIGKSHHAAGSYSSENLDVHVSISPDNQERVFVTVTGQTSYGYPLTTAIELSRTNAEKLSNKISALIDM